MKLLNFLKDNHNLVKRYHKRWHKKEMVLCKDARSKIIVLFIHTLNASNAGGNLNNKGSSIEKLREDTKSLTGDDQLSFSSFTKALLGKSYQKASKEAIDSLFHQLVNNFKQVGHKKAALFLRDLLYTGGKDIFTDVNPSIVWPLLIVPVDKVIDDLLNTYFGIKKKNDEWNEFLVKKYPQKHMYYEDLWFWGHFGTEIKNKHRVIKEDGNEPMFLMDPIMTIMPNRYISDVKEQIRRFARILGK